MKQRSILTHFLMAALSVLALAPSVSQAQAGANDASGATDALQDYEHIRAALGADSGAGVAQFANHLATHATAASHASSGSSAQHWTAAAAAAHQLASDPAADLNALRNHFSALSHALIDILNATPALAHGLHVFNCPMFGGYGGWIQRTDSPQNPYMGSQMAGCGTPMALPAPAMPSVHAQTH